MLTMLYDPCPKVKVPKGDTHHEISKDHGTQGNP